MVSSFQVTLTYIASQLQESEIQELGDLFKSIDKNGDGCLSLEEVKEALKIPEGIQHLKELQSLISSIDTDSNGTINYTGYSSEYYLKGSQSLSQLAWINQSI